MIETTSIPEIIKERINARGARDSDSEAWLAARRIGTLLKDKYRAKNVIVFGSLAKKAWTRYSDIDLAVRGIPAELYFKAFAEAETLSTLCPIDLIDLDDCLAGVIEEIEREGVPV